MIPRIVHQTSKIKTLLPEERRLRARAQRLLPDWEFCLWDDADNISLMRRHFRKLADAYESLRPGVAKADIARCAYMHVYGGFYIDTDYKLLRPIDGSILLHDCILPMSRTGAVGSAEFRIGNAILGSAAGHPFWSGFIKHVLTRLDRSAIDEALIELTTGPKALTAYYTEHCAAYTDIFLAPRRLFHPQLRRFDLLANPNGSHGVHLCWGSWRSRNLRHLVRNSVSRFVASH